MQRLEYSNNSNSKSVTTLSSVVATLFHSKQPATTDFNSLPIDILVYLTKFLPVSDLLPFLLTNTKTYSLMGEEAWRLSSLQIKIPAEIADEFAIVKFNEMRDSLLEIYKMERKERSIQRLFKIACYKKTAAYGTGVIIFFLLIGLYFYIAMHLDYMNPIHSLYFMAALFMTGGGSAGSMMAATMYSDKVLDTDAVKKQLFYLTHALEAEKRVVRGLSPLEKRSNKFITKYDKYPYAPAAKSTPAIFKP